MPYEGEGRDQGYASIIQATPRVTNKPPEAGQVHGTDFLSQPTEGTNPANSSMSDS